MTDDEKESRRELVASWFSKYDDEYTEFDNIPEKEKRHRRPDVCAFIYLDEKLGSSDNDAIAAAEHDEIYLSWDNLEILTEEDVLYIARCGVRYDESNDSLTMFV